MKKRILIKAVLSAVLGHAVGLLFLLLAASVMLKLEKVSEGTFALSMIGLIVGAIVAGALSNGRKNGILTSVICGGVFSGAHLFISLFGDGNHSVLTRLGFFVGLFLLVMISSLVIGGKRRAKRKASRIKRMARRV